MTSRGAFSKIRKIFQKLRSGRGEKFWKLFEKCCSPEWPLEALFKIGEGGRVEKFLKTFWKCCSPEWPLGALFRKSGKFFKNFILGRVKIVWNAWEIVSSWDRAEVRQNDHFRGSWAFSRGILAIMKRKIPKIEYFWIPGKVLKLR